MPLHRTPGEAAPCKFNEVDGCFESSLKQRVALDSKTSQALPRMTKNAQGIKT
jgi:hypothetical protein